MLRLVTDENFNGDIVRGLLRRHPELELVRVQDIGLMETPDPDILEWAARQGRVLLSSSFIASFAEVEVDVETGKVTLIDYLGVGDVGTVVNPRSLLAQIRGRSCLGIAHALQQKLACDPQYGLSLAGDSTV